MGNCIYCGKPAGFLHKKHQGCETQHLQREHVIQTGKQRIRDEVADGIKGSVNFDELEKAISEIERSSFVPAAELKTLLIDGWEKCVKDLVENGVVDPTQETRLVAFQRRFDLTDGDLNKYGTHTVLVKAAVLRDVLSGTVPKRFSFTENLPVNLQKGEQVVWGFCDTRYLEDRIRREYVGGSKGLSVRVAKGVYYHTSAFKGHAVEHTESVEVDRGWAVVTDKNIYFAGSTKSLRVPYSKVVSFESFSNGIGFMRDAASAKAQFLLTGDGWFTYNLVTNLAKL